MKAQTHELKYDYNYKYFVWNNSAILKVTNIVLAWNFDVTTDVCKVMHDNVLIENVHQFKSLII